MENASKALLIAAGILVGLIVISLIIIVHRQVSSYYNAKEQSKIVEQLSDFNEQYIPYNRKDVRGSDLLSLINKIENFNTLNPDEEEIEISINIKGASNIYYGGNKTSGGDILINIDTIYDDDEIFEVIKDADIITRKYSQGMATKLAANITTLMGGNLRKSPEDLLDELKIDKTKYGGIENIQNDILKYYQYQQFKRAHFDCTKLDYTTQGRVESFEFKFNGKFE